MSNDDWIAADRDHLLRMEREKTARTIARWQGVGYVAAAIGVAGVLCVGIYALWSGVQNNAERASAERIACQQKGGTMFDLAQNGRVCLTLESGDQQ